MGTWRAAPAKDQVAGTSPRYATLDGPRTLVACGAPTGYGWYRIEMKVSSTAKRLVHFPGLADRAQMFLDGEPVTEAALRTAIRQFKQTETDLVCLIGADETTPHGDVVGLIDLVKQEGVAKFAINIDPVEPPPEAPA